MKIAVVRGKFLNQYEMQNFEPMLRRHEIVGFSSLKPIHDKFSFPVDKLPSPVDLPFPNQRIKIAVLNRLFVDAHYLFGLEEKLKGFDIVHTAETYYRYTQQCLNAKKKGYIKKVVATVWENIPFNNEGIRGRRKFKQRAIEEVDHFIAVTNGAKKALIEEGCKSNKITVIPMGVDLNEFKPRLKVHNNGHAKFILRQAQDGERSRTISASKGILKQVQDDAIQRATFTILFVGRLEEEKGIMELLEAFRMLVEGIKKPHLMLRIIGRGSLGEYIVRRSKEWGISDRIEVEEKTYEEIPEVYKKADIFVLPSKPSKYWLEQFGMVLVEAMVCGLPATATKSGAIPEVLGKAGILVAPGDSQALYQGLRRLIENPQLRFKFSKMGRKRAETYFDSQKIAKKIEEIYLQLLS